MLDVHLSKQIMALYIIKRIKTSTGFTLLEAMISTVILGLMATGVSLAYISGLNSLDEQADRMFLDSYLRSRVEFIIAEPFAQVNNGSENVSVGGKNYTINWTVVLKDLDGDMITETTAKEVTVSVAGISGRSITMIIVDNESRLGKI